MIIVNKPPHVPMDAWLRHPSNGELRDRLTAKQGLGTGPFPQEYPVDSGACPESPSQT